MQHWLYYVVPCLFGNAERRVFGENSRVSSYQGVLTRLVAVAGLLLLALASPADARPRHHHRHHASHVQHAHSGYGPRPSAWCGYFMRQRTGIKDVSLNLARNWARVGSPASGPAPGVIGVQAHHVFEVVSVVGPGRVLAISGNDGHQVKTRVRSTGKVIAWRRV